MGSRQTTTIAVLVTMRLPVGAHAADGITFVKDALSDRQKLLQASAPGLPVAALATHEIQVKLVRKETQYL